MAGMSHPMKSAAARTLLAATLAALFSVPLLAQPPAPQPLVIDASAPTPAPGPANYTYDPADAKSPSGHILGLNAQYLTLDGKPWLPVMGEIHYSRVPEAEWETEILKMKSAGVQVIAAYIIWIHHEEIEGQWDWAGQKDLRRFVQLCAKHGLYVVPRIGPWSHAEVRNGGFPDWLLAKAPQNRTNDPTYLHFVDLYYQQIAAQLKGLMWSEGGPVIAIQLENEYHNRGPLGGNAHILKLKELARSAGLRVPFYTVTSWDGASIPAGQVLPVGGGYPDAPWDASIEALPPNAVYAFHFGRRAATSMGTVGVQTPTGEAAAPNTTPSITAEMGGGMQITYHRRPIVSADDIAAMMPVALGSGVNLYGTYMFHGGENPDGKLTTLQESLATHYANDLPVKSYDFQAPIGEFGDERESLLKLKTWNYFLNDFGPILAPMQPHAPDVLPAGPADFSVPRVAARTSGQSGFLFVNNHVRGSAMPARENFQVTIKLPNDKSVTLPSHPITLPSDAYFVWPFNMDLSGLHLRYATAQPLAILGTKAAPVYAFVSQPNIPAEFLIDNMAGLKLNRISGSRNVQVTVDNTTISLLGVPSGPDPILNCTLPNGRSVTILLLSQRNADHAWKINSGAQTQLLLQTSKPSSTAMWSRSNLSAQKTSPRSSCRMTACTSSHSTRLLALFPALGHSRSPTPQPPVNIAAKSPPKPNPPHPPPHSPPASNPPLAPVSSPPPPPTPTSPAPPSTPSHSPQPPSPTPPPNSTSSASPTPASRPPFRPIDGKDHLLDDNFAAGTTLARRPLPRFAPEARDSPAPNSISPSIPCARTRPSSSSPATNPNPTPRPSSSRSNSSPNTPSSSNSSPPARSPDPLTSSISLKAHSS